MMFCFEYHCCMHGKAEIKIRSEILNFAITLQPVYLILPNDKMINDLIMITFFLNLTL